MPDMTDSAPAPEGTTPTQGGAEEEARRFAGWLQRADSEGPELASVNDIVARVTALLLAAERRGAEAMRERAAKVAEAQSGDYATAWPRGGRMDGLVKIQTTDQLAAAIRSLSAGQGGSDGR